LDSNEKSISRKVSVSIILNDDYEGGEICFRTSETGTCQRPTAGNVIAFSSFIPHKVKPITSGERYAVVVWFTGPCFR
jgi:PKHD-type hydroxylase